MKSESNLFALLMRPSFDSYIIAPKGPLDLSHSDNSEPILRPPGFQNFPGKRTSTPGLLGHPTLRATLLRSLSSVV